MGSARLSPQVAAVAMFGGLAEPATAKVVNQLAERIRIS